MSKLIRPDNGQPAEFIEAKNGFICLRTSCISPAVRWFSDEQMFAVSPVATCAEPPPIQGCELPPRVIEIIVTPDMIGKEGKPGAKAIPGINPSECSGVVVKVMPPVSLWHESMAA